MSKRKRQSPLRHGADPMQPRVYKEPPAPDDPAEQSPPAVGSSGGPAANPTPASLPVAVPIDPPRPPPPPEPTKKLEDRLNKLEDLLKGIRAQQFTTAPAASSSGPALPGADVLLSASQVLLPLAGQVMQPLTDPTRAAAFAANLRTDGPLFFEIYAELRCMLRMLVDPRYRLSWATRFVPLGLIALMVFAWLSLSGMAYLGPVLDRMAFAALLYLLYKVLGREAHRYRLTSPDLPPSLRP